jgi:peptidoglycan/LPS O-acetylase OafA/YrhL
MEWWHPVLIVVHATAGGLGLLLAGPVMLAPKRRGRHPALGRIYAICAGVLCLTAFGLVAEDPRGLAGLAVLGVLTAGWVAGGVWLARRRPVLRGDRHAWRLWHLNLMGSSVISFVTAFLVQITGGSLAAWIAPTVVGTVIIATANRREPARLAARKSPRQAPSAARR